MKRTQCKYSLCRLGHSAVRGISSHKTSDLSSLDVLMQTGANGSRFQAGHMLAQPIPSQMHSLRDLVEWPESHVVTLLLNESWFMPGQWAQMCLRTPRHLLASRLSSVALGSPGEVMNNSYPRTVSPLSRTVSPLSSTFWASPCPPTPPTPSSLLGKSLRVDGLAAETPLFHLVESYSVLMNFDFSFQT